MLQKIHARKLDSVEEPGNTERRAFIRGSLAALAASPLLVSSQKVMGQQAVHQVDTPTDPFILLLTGIYKPVPFGQGPKDNLGLTTVSLSDGTYSETKIYPIFGITNEGGVADQDRTIGNFFVQFAGNKCAYQLPSGAMAMQFNPPPTGAPPGFNGFVPFPDGSGGFFLEGTFELVISEATGIYQPFKGGHNHMVDKLHQLAPVSSGQFDEFCFCNISTYQFP